MSRKQGDEGVALILALLFVVLLTALVVDFNYDMNVEASLIESQVGEFEAYLAAKSGIAGGMGLLAADQYVDQELNMTQDLSIIDSLYDVWAEGIPLAPVNEAMMQCLVSDEYGKININALLETDNEGNDILRAHVEKTLRALFQLREMDPNPTDAIIDWIDYDDEEYGTDGAESDYYEGLETPYKCKNGPMDSIEELLLIPGITPEVYYGDREKEQFPLSDLLTVHGHPEGKINVNTAAYEVLWAHFEAEGRLVPSDQYAADVIERLESEGPFESVDELQDLDLVPNPRNRGDRQRETEREQEQQEGAEQEQESEEDIPREPVLEVASSVFRIVADGQSGDAKTRIEAFVFRASQDDLEADQLFRVLDWRVIR